MPSIISPVSRFKKVSSILFYLLIRINYRYKFEGARMIKEEREKIFLPRFSFGLVSPRAKNFLYAFEIFEKGIPLLLLSSIRPISFSI